MKFVCFFLNFPDLSWLSFIERSFRKIFDLPNTANYFDITQKEAPFI